MTADVVLHKAGGLLLGRSAQRAVKAGGGGGGAGEEQSQSQLVQQLLAMPLQQVGGQVGGTVGSVGTPATDVDALTNLQKFFFFYILLLVRYLVCVQPVGVEPADREGFAAGAVVDCELDGVAREVLGAGGAAVRSHAAHLLL